MSNPTTPFSWQMPTSTDLVTDLPADFEVFGQAVATSMADLLGGTTGQVLSKTTNTDMDFTWVSPNPGDITAVNVTSPITGGGSSGDVTIGIQAGSTTQSGAVQLTDSTSSTSTTTAATPNAVKTSYDLANGAIAKSTVTTTGDIIYRNATVPTRLGIGTAGQVLTVNSGATAPQWATPATPASGFTKITSASFSAVANTGTTFDGVFTSSYTNYVIVVNGSAGNDLKLQLRKSGTTHTSDYLYGGQAIPYSGSAALIQGATTAWTLQTFSGGNQNQVTINISNVGTGSQLPVFTSIGANYSYGGVTVNGGIINASIASTGFILSVPSGTMTGTAYVYGLAI